MTVEADGRVIDPYVQRQLKFGPFFGSRMYGKA